jgi:hypothetical protein
VLGNNPNGALGAQDGTVGVTGVLDVAGFVLQGFPVNIVSVIEMKNVGITRRTCYLLKNSG